MASQNLSPAVPSQSGLASAHCVFTQGDTDLHKDMPSGLNAHVLIGDTLRHNTHKHTEFADTHSACPYKYAALIMIAKIYTALTLYLSSARPRKQSLREGPVVK